jgi:hypothetical protein
VVVIARPVLSSLVCPDAMAVRTDDITLGNLRRDRFPGQARAAGSIRQVKSLLLPRPVVKIHDVVWIPVAAVGTRNLFRLADSIPVAFYSLVLEIQVVLFVPLVVLALVSTMADATPMLRFPVGSDPEGRKGQLGLAPGANSRHAATSTERVKGIEPS